MQTDQPAVEIVRPQGQGAVVLVCEHASRFMPAEYENLGLADDALASHAAWDIGARDVALALSDLFDAPLVAGGVSRLIYDLNRPLEAPSSIPERSEIFDIPGNISLSEDARRARFATYHEPFHAALAEVLDARDGRALVTVHSFTPVYNGERRDVEIGFLHDASDTFAHAALSAEVARGRYRAALNEPYAATDGVTYTLAKHGEARGLPTLMIEIRNDLIGTPETAKAMAEHLHKTLSTAIATLSRAEKVMK